jgi:hypothetical protein
MNATNPKKRIIFVIIETPVSAETTPPLAESDDDSCGYDSDDLIYQYEDWDSDDCEFGR